MLLLFIVQRLCLLSCPVCCPRIIIGVALPFSGSFYLLAPTVSPPSATQFRPTLPGGGLLAVEREAKAISKPRKTQWRPASPTSHTGHSGARFQPPL